MDLDSAAAAAGVAGTALGLATAVSTRLSTDRAEERYRKSLDADLVATFEAALDSDDEIVTGELVEPSSARSRPHRSEDDARRRMAALPIDYHAQVLAQARQSFIFSIGAAVVGFVIVAISILLVLGDQVAPGVASMVGAVLAEAVAALFFRQSNRARALMSGQLEGFRAAEETDRKARERRELIQMVEDPDTRDQLITQTVLKLAEPDRHRALPPTNDDSSPADLSGPA